MISISSVFEYNQLKVYHYKIYYCIIILFVITSHHALNVTEGKFSLVNIQLTNFGADEAKLGELKYHVFIKKLANRWNLMYRAICSGNIITQERVLTSSHCFLTNRKRYRHSLSTLKIVAGILETYAQHPIHDNVQQWRSIQHIYSQKFFRFPAYNLAVVVVDRPWIFNQFINKIPYAVKDQDFNGVCRAVVVKAAKSWAHSKKLLSEEFTMLTRSTCETTLLRSCRLYHCTQPDTRELLLDSIESEGSGLICYETGDPEEKDENEGVLVGITSLIYVKMPSLHHKVALFNKWITDDATRTIGVDCALLLFCFLIKCCI